MMARFLNITYIWRMTYGPIGRQLLGNDEISEMLKAENVACVRSEVLTAVITKSFIFWDIMPCSPLSLKNYATLYPRRQNCSKDIIYFRASSFHKIPDAVQKDDG
jgi:hypothetical protein